MKNHGTTSASGGIDRRTFLKTAGAIGVGVAASTFGIPKLLMATPKVIKIGQIEPVTGPLSVVGQGMRNAGLIAAEYINSKGGIKALGGAKVELLLGDSESKADIGRQEADRLLKEGAVVLAGPFQSGTAMAIATLAEQREVPFVMDVAALDAITQKGYKYSFRIFPTANTFGKSVCKYIGQILQEKDIHPKRAVLTNTADPFGKDQGANFLKWFEKSGFSMDIVDHVSYPLGIHDLSAEVARIKAAKPDLLFPITRPGDSIILTRELYKQKVPLMGIISPGSPGWYEPKVVEDLGKLAYYVMDNVPWINDQSPVYQEANKRFSAKYGTYLDTNSGYGYTAILVIADALERAGSTEPESIVEALRKTNFKDQPMVGEAIRFAENGDNINAVTPMIQILPDPDPLKRVKVVLPKEFAQADYIFPAPQLWERG